MADQTPTPEDFERARKARKDAELETVLREAGEPYVCMYPADFYGSFEKAYELGRAAGAEEQAASLAARLEAAERKVAAWGPIITNGLLLLDGKNEAEGKMWRGLVELKPEDRP